MVSISRHITKGAGSGEYSEFSRRADIALQVGLAIADRGGHLPYVNEQLAQCRDLTMIRAEFIQRNEGRALRLEGRLVGAWAVQVKSLLSRHFVSHGFLVDVSKVTYVDSVGEQLLVWLRDLRAESVAETCYARNVCEKLQLDLQGKETLQGLSRQRIEVLPS